MGGIFITLGEVYRYLNQTEPALFYLTSVVKIFEELGDKRGLIGTWLEIGKVYHALHDYSQAEQAYALSLELATQAHVWGWPT